jgi:hypothetical protein
VELHRKKGGKTILVIGGGIIPKRRIPCLNGWERAYVSDLALPFLKSACSGR